MEIQHTLVYEYDNMGLTNMAGMTVLQNGNKRITSMIHYEINYITAWKCKVNDITTWDLK